MPRRKRRLRTRFPFVLLGASLCGACASPWQLAPGSVPLAGTPPALPPHRAVAESTLEFHGTTVRSLAYLRIRGGDIGAHFGTESGLTILDLEVRGAEVRVVAESPLAGSPEVVRVLGEDLRRLYGDLGVFGLGSAFPPAREVLGDPEGRVALPLPGGSWVALSPASLAEGGFPLRAILLGPDLLPRAEVDYLDPDTDGIPREVRLRDLLDGHRVVLEIVEVLPCPSGAAEDSP